VGLTSLFRPFRATAPDQYPTQGGAASRHVGTPLCPGLICCGPYRGEKPTPGRYVDADTEDNNEDFGPDSLLGRASDREVVLKRTLRDKLAELNPGLPDEAYEDAVRQITGTVASQSLTATNREKYDLIRDGVRVAFRNDKGERVRERLRVFDFAEPANNHFLCVRELWVRGDLYRRRADIVGFVNGLPLLFIECKNIHKNLKVAFEKNFSDYKDTIPHLFHHNAIVMFGNGQQAKIGSITSRWGHVHEWKRLAEEESGVVDMETLLKGVCDKRNFMDLVENFIVFDESSGEPKKILARNHQFLGVNRQIPSQGAGHLRRHTGGRRTRRRDRTGQTGGRTAG